MRQHLSYILTGKAIVAPTPAVMRVRRAVYRSRVIGSAARATLACAKPTVAWAMVRKPHMREIIGVGLRRRWAFALEPEIYRARIVGKVLHATRVAVREWRKVGKVNVVESSFCCDTGRYYRDHTFTSPLAAVRCYVYLNTHDISDGPTCAWVEETV